LKNKKQTLFFVKYTHIKAMLKPITIYSPPNRKSTLLLVIIILFAGMNCGKRTPPVPPIEKISQRAVISGIQRGYAINLFWEIPENYESKERSSEISRADIYRLVEISSASITLSEEEFASRSTLIATIPISASSPKQLNYNDNLDFFGQSTRLRYAVRFVNSDGQKAAFSNFLLIEPTAKIGGSPTSLSGKVFQNRIQISWNAPASNIDGSLPLNIIGYNIYKTVEDSTAKVINDAPVTSNNFNDNFFEFGRVYKYFIRTISLGNNGMPIESLDSIAIEIRPEDKFAPIPPSAITIAAAPNNLSIFFAVNPEKDIAGYRIYRSTDLNQPKPNWLLITNELLTTNTFQDKTVESGKTYYYYLTAIDQTGNISEPSETVSETAP